ncbi:hypothetical protein GBA65_17820 [Rubrobacter marinus]|uniref:Uncharacterized protein n=1 Tax=Rubrobacter marinus TaxID=2653852 RepID=A0A6G8Q0R7_9ACTN|nr:hypothetical protein [Rubrobacter marinus]QIN80071.1 hypothetical protein GBA65_17820 [Rubrobacter marinus]
MITLSLLLVAGCSASGGPREQANEAIAEANETVAEHDRLFEEARQTYEGAREAIEAGEDPEAQAERVAEARGTLTEARARLEEAREPLLGVQNLDVEPEIKDYAGLVAEAMDAQLEAEAAEIEFYEILESDPILRGDREQALDTLSEVEESYERAEASYARSREVADANPELIGG